MGAPEAPDTLDPIDDYIDEQCGSRAEFEALVKRLEPQGYSLKVYSVSRAAYELGQIQDFIDRLGEPEQHGPEVAQPAEPKLKR